MDTLSWAIRYDSKGAFNHIALLYDIIVPLLKSNLVSELAVNTYMAFCEAFFTPSADHLRSFINLILQQKLNKTLILNNNQFFYL